MSKKIVYKVVAVQLDGRYTSVMFSIVGTTYCKDIVVRRPIEGGPLCTFDTSTHALVFLEHICSSFFEYQEYEIWKCRGKVSTDREIYLTKYGNRYHISHLPEGTILVDSLSYIGTIHFGKEVNQTY